MPMEGGGVRCSNPQNTFGVSGVNSDAAKTNTIQVTGDHFFRCNGTTGKINVKCLRAAPVVSSKCPEAPTFIFHLKRLH